MGQAQTSSVWDTYEPNSDLPLGTYRIVHDGTDKVLQLQDNNNKMLILQLRQDQGSDNNLVENDHWFLLRSGDGFIFKHCRQGTYITTLLLTTASPQSVSATRYPTTWVIHTKQGNISKCAITIATDQNEPRTGGKYVGLGVTWAGLCIAPLSVKEEPDQLWRLERIGDATVEENYEQRVRQLEHELQAANARWTSDESKLTIMRNELDAKGTRLDNIRNELSKQAAELENVRSDLDRQAGELKEQFNALDTIRDLLDAKERALSEKDKVAISDNNTAIREKDQSIQGGEDTPPRSEASEGLVMIEQVPESTTQDLRCENTNNLSRSHSPVQRLVPDPSLAPEVRSETSQSPPLPAALDKQLAQLGWSFD